MSETVLSNPPDSDSREVEPQPAPPDEEFVHLFTQAQRRLFLFILAQVPNPADAEEILQETNVIIWRKRAAFRLGTNFFAWACRIASYEVLKFRDRRRRDRLRFSNEFVERIAAEVISGADNFEERQRALAGCLKKLRPKDCELIQRRYAPGETGQSVAAMLGRPVNSVYQSLGRIRRTLLDCVRRHLAIEAGR